MSEQQPPTPSEQALLSGLALSVFELNGQFLSIAEDMASAGALTATRWQVLGAILNSPATVAQIARTMGMTRQGVQRVANELVAAGAVEFVDNPAHKRAKLLTPTEFGRAAVAAISPGHARVAAALAADVGVERLQQILTALADLSAAVDRIAPVAAQERQRPRAGHSR